LTDLKNVISANWILDISFSLLSMLHFHTLEQELLSFYKILVVYRFLFFFF
jgi:hypothetical protein